MDRSKFEITIITFYPERKNSRINDFKDLGIEVIQLNLRRFQFFKKRIELKKYINALDIDIVHSNSVFTDIISDMCRLKVPVLITLHNYLYEDLISQYGVIVGNLLCLLEKKAIFNASKVVTCSKTLHDKYCKVFNREFIAIPNGIDSEYWSEETYSKKELRRILEIPNEDHIFLTTGLLIERKNTQMVIRAFLNANLNSSKLIILGDGADKEECKKIADNSNKIIFRGRVNNVKDYLFASDTLVSMSKSEGLPYAVLEAEATGIRMILSNIPQHKEVVNNQSLVHYVDLNNQKELEDIMTKEEKEENRIKYSMDDYVASKMSKKYQKTYEMMVYDQYD